MSRCNRWLWLAWLLAGMGVAHADTLTGLENNYGPFNRGMSTEAFIKATTDGKCHDATIDSSPVKLCGGTTTWLSQANGIFANDKLYSLSVQENGSETGPNARDGVYIWIAQVAFNTRKYGAPAVHLENVVALAGTINEVIWYFPDGAGLVLYVARRLSDNGITYSLNHGYTWPKP